MHITEWQDVAPGPCDRRTISVKEYFRRGGVYLDGLNGLLIDGLSPGLLKDCPVRDKQSKERGNVYKKRSQASKACLASNLLVFKSRKHLLNFWRLKFL